MELALLIEQAGEIGMKSGRTDDFHVFILILVYMQRTNFFDFSL